MATTENCPMQDQALSNEAIKDLEARYQRIIEMQLQAYTDLQAQSEREIAKVHGLHKVLGVILVIALGLFYFFLNDSFGDLKEEVRENLSRDAQSWVTTEVSRLTDQELQDRVESLTRVELVKLRRDVSLALDETAFALQWIAQSLESDKAPDTQQREEARQAIQALLQKRL